MNLYRRIDYDPELEDGFGENVQYVGVYALRWHDRPNQPSVAFVEVEEDVQLKAQLDQAIVSLNELVYAMIDYQMEVEDTPPFRHRKMMRKAQAIIDTKEDE